VTSAAAAMSDDKGWKNGYSTTRMSARAKVSPTFTLKNRVQEKRNSMMDQPLGMRENVITHKRHGGSRWAAASKCWPLCGSIAVASKYVESTKPIDRKQCSVS